MRDLERIEHLCLFHGLFRFQTKTLGYLFSMRTQVLSPLGQIDNTGRQFLIIHLFDIPDPVPFVQLMKSELQIVLLPISYNFF